jgi:hypothetical protein
VAGELAELLGGVEQNHQGSGEPLGEGVKGGLADVGGQVEHDDVHRRAVQRLPALRGVQLAHPILTGEQRFQRDPQRGVAGHEHNMAGHDGSAYLARAAVENRRMAAAPEDGRDAGWIDTGYG